MAQPSIQRFSETPRVYVADDFVSQQEIDHILSRGADVAALQLCGIKTRHDETGFSFEMPVVSDTILEAYRERLHRTIGVKSVFDGTMRFRRYGPGDGHPPHVDTYEIDGQTLIITAHLFLTAPEVGGSTTFPDALPEAFEVKALPGRLAIWFSVAPDGTNDMLSMHAGAPVEQGLKTTLTYFIYEDRAQAAVQIAAAESLLPHA